MSFPSIIAFIMGDRVTLVVLYHVNLNTNVDHNTPTQKILFDYSGSATDAIRTSLVIGRLRIVFGPVLTSTWRTRPSSPGKTLMTRPLDHLFRGRSLSKTRTMSLMDMLRRGLFHFFLTCETRTYSLLNRCQNSLARCWTARHRFLQYTSACWNTPGGGRTTLDFMVSR